jgi:hypothetical protein
MRMGLHDGASPCPSKSTRRAWTPLMLLSVCMSVCLFSEDPKFCRVLVTAFPDASVCLSVCPSVCMSRT